MSGGSPRLRELYARGRISAVALRVGNAFREDHQIAREAMRHAKMTRLPDGSGHAWSHQGEAAIRNKRALAALGEMPGHLLVAVVWDDLSPTEAAVRRGLDGRAGMGILLDCLAVLARIEHYGVPEDRQSREPHVAA